MRQNHIEQSKQQQCMRFAKGWTFLHSKWIRQRKTPKKTDNIFTVISEVCTITSKKNCQQLHTERIFMSTDYNFCCFVPFLLPSPALSVIFCSLPRYPFHSLFLFLSHTLSLFVVLFRRQSFILFGLEFIHALLWCCDFALFARFHAFDDATIVCLLFDSLISMHIRAQQSRSAFVYESVTWIYLVNCASTTAHQTTCAQM